MEERRCPIGFVLEIGDPVTVSFDQWFRDGHRKIGGGLSNSQIAHPHPRSGPATVIDFPSVVQGRLHNHGFGAGKFEDRSRAIIKYVDGAVIEVSTAFLDFVDSSQRFDKYRPYADRGYLIPHPAKQADLPRTDLCEGDLVVYTDPIHREARPETHVLINIDYDAYFDGTSHLPVARTHSIGPDIYAKPRFSCRNGDLKLATRGDIWSFWTDGSFPPSIVTTEDKANFLNLVGEAETLLNIERHDGLWRLSDALRLITRGEAHTFTSPRPISGPDSLVFLKRFKDLYDHVGLEASTRITEMLGFLI